MKTRAALLLPLFLISLSGCDSSNKKTSPYVEPAKDINSMADFEKMVEDNPIKNESTKTPIRYSLNVNLDFQNYPGKQYKMKDVELIGNGHKLQNIQIYEANNSGLFSKVKNCIFRNLVITDSSFTGSDAGALVGNVEIGIFDRVKITDTVEIGDSTGSRIGGIVGNAENVSFESCENNGIVNGESNVGGIVGLALNSDITHCINNGEITGGTLAQSIGGIAGTFSNSWRYDAREDQFDSNENHGNINGKECDFVGGLIGEHIAHTEIAGSKLPIVNISRCINDGIVEGENNVGGIAGNAMCDACDVIFTSCTNKGITKGTKNVGGIAGLTEDSVNTEESRVRFNNCKTELNENGDNYILGVSKVGGIAGNGAYFTSCTNDVDVITLEDTLFPIGSKYYEQYQSYIGGIVGYGCSVEQTIPLHVVSCINNGKVLGVEDSEKPYRLASAVGGICGFTNGGKISKSNNNGEINATLCVGGIIGALEPVQEIGISNCESNGNMIFLKSGGGVIGDIESSNEHHERTTITQCKVEIEEAKIYGSTSEADDKFVAGGFIGRASSSSLDASHYKTVILANSESSLSYRSPNDAINMVIDACVGFNKYLEIEPLVYNTVSSDKASVTRLGDIE